MRFFKPALLTATALTLALGACSAPTPETQAPAIEQTIQKIIKHDKFTYANYDQVQVTHLDLDLDVKFDEKVLDGMATLDFKRIVEGSTELVLDSRNLLVKAVAIENADGEWTPADYTLGEADAAFGSRFSINIGETATKVRIGYRTSPDAEGLQWLSPAQTAGKKHPYLFSQAQTINARTMAPLQDTPAVRITYTATLRTPPELLALMSAEQDTGPIDGEYHFSMPQPIPSYLLAIAVGDIKFKAINDHIGVYAEQYILDASAAEFEDTPLMEQSNAKLYGPYRWGRYDLIVLPPSFPFGGMENPRLSFMTPTLIAGDKSLTNVVAHELAHSWSGNLVTNSNWRDAWLNEGFTSYVENRVMEDLYGKDRAVMEQALSLEDLKRDIADAARPELTQLKLPVDMAHPDDAFSQVAYVKGQFFLMFLEQRFGRANFDAFLKQYFDHFAFQSITTEDFITYLHDELHVKNPDALTKEELNEWVYQPGLPATAADPQSSAFENVSAQQAKWLKGDTSAANIETAGWSTHEWLHFLNNLPSGLSQAQFAELDAAFSLTGTQNAETAFAWYMQTIQGGYAPATNALESFLMSVGRGKFIYRLYNALNQNGQSEWAQDVFSRAKPGYHPIAQRRISDILSPK
ncbi:MAG: aminopeptidase [Robiginitomaculum sp.]|nr:MAG: aminopeptidase [Robiginitomaculum sp.]